MTPPALNIVSLSVHAGRRCLLDIEHARAEAGSITALMGPNGAGKSTLLRTCLGLTRPSGGCVRVLGEEVPALSSAALAALRRRIGYVPQLLPGHSELPLTLREVVAIGRTACVGLLRPLSRRDWELVDEWTERLGLSPLANRAFRQLSGGEQRKTLIARAMAQEPELLLFDEPTANLDLGWRERIVETIETLYAQTRVGVVLVCHELEVLPPACRHVIFLQAGRAEVAGPPERVFTTERVRQLYGARLQVVHQSGRHTVIPGGDAHA